MCQKGFTLAELLITIAVGAVLMALGVPAYTSFLQNARQVSSVNELVSTLHAARDLAVTRNARITVCPSSTGADCEAVSWTEGWIVFQDLDGGGSVNGLETIDRVVDEVGIPSITTAEFDDFLIFRPNGRVMVNTLAENTGQLTFCDERGAARARVLIVDVGGRPRSSDKQANGASPVCP
jgi:type IV fimbrial biogenesis protein FimT